MLWYVLIQYYHKFNAHVCRSLLCKLKFVYMGNESTQLSFQTFSFLKISRIQVTKYLSHDIPSCDDTANLSDLTNKLSRDNTFISPFVTNHSWVKLSSDFVVKWRLKVLQCVYRYFAQDQKKIPMFTEL